MNIKLLKHTDLDICSSAIRTCWQSQDKGDHGGPKDKNLIDRVGNKLKHKSTLEHLVYSFYISGISRAVLQELARHRLASLSVKSSRYTLKELRNEDSFLKKENLVRVKEYVVLTKDKDVNKSIIFALENLRKLVKHKSNDLAKYAMPEAYKTELTWTINARSLQNFLELRTGKTAFPEIRKLAYNIYYALPEDHKYIFIECLTK